MVLLTVMDPFVGSVLLLFFGVLFQAIFNLLWIGMIKLLKLKIKYEGYGKKLFFTCFLATLFIAFHNIFEFSIVIKFMRIFKPEYDNIRFQPLEILAIWGIVSTVVTFLSQPPSNT